MRKNAFRNAKATKTDTLLRVRYEIYVSMLRFHFYDGAKIFLRQYITTIMNFNQMNSSLYIRKYILPLSIPVKSGQI